MDAAFQFSDTAQVYPYVAARKMSTPTSTTRSTLRTPTKLELPLITSEEAASYLTGRRLPDVLIFIDKQPYFQKRVPRKTRVQATEYSVVMLVKFGKTQMRILYPAVVSKQGTCVPVIRKRASSFQLSPDAFERLRDFATSFVETIRTWLREICSKPHFLDKTWDVCDLEEECAHRHHVIIPYFRKATHGPFPGVLMCRKSDTMEDLFVRVVFFDVKDLKVKDHEDNVLKSFHEVWSNFVGIPSPKRADDRPPGSEFDSKSFFNFLDPKRHTSEIHIKHLKELQSYLVKNLHRLSHQKASEMELLLANLVGLLFSPNMTVVNLTAHVLADLCVWKVARIGEQIYGMWMKLMDDRALYRFGFRGLDALLNLEATNTLVKWLCNYTDCATILPELLQQSKAISSIEKYRESVMLQVERQYHRQAKWSEKQLKEDSDDSSGYCDTVDTHETWPGSTSSLWGPGKEKAVIPRLKLSLARRRGLSSNSGVEAQWTSSGDRDQRREDMVKGTSHELNKKAVHARMRETARESGEGLLMNDLSALVKRKQESELKKEMLKHEAGVKRRSERQRIFKREEHSDREFGGEDVPLKASLQGKPPPRIRLKCDAEQVVRWRKIRLSGIRILSRLCVCDPERLHSIIPVSAIYVMLSSSCSLSGANVVSLAHFLPDKDLSAEQNTVGHKGDLSINLGPDYDNCSEDRKAILLQTLESVKKPRMCACGSELLLKSTSKSTSPTTGWTRAQRSPMTRSSSSSSTSLSSPKEKVVCTCFTPLLSTALWSLLKSYSDAVDVKLGNLERGSRNGANSWANQRDAAQIRNKLDCFICRVERGIRDLLPALEGTKNDAFSYYRLGHVLLFGAQYLTKANKPQVSENAFIILSHSLLCVKSQLMKDIVKTRFVPSRIFLWVAYAFLAAVLMDNTSVLIAEGVLGAMLDFDEKARLSTSSGRSTSSRLLRTPSAKRYLPHSIQSPGVPHGTTPTEEERIPFRDVLTQMIEYVLVSPRAENILTKHWGTKRFDHCRCRALSYIQSIATVVSRNKNSHNDDTQWLQRPKEMMTDFNHMVPAIREWLDTVHAADNAVIPTLSKSSTCRRQVKLVLLNCERCLFSTWIQSEPLVHGRHKQMLESYVRNHFFSFIKIYHTGRWANVQDTMDVLLCRMHGRALIALSSGNAGARDVFNHLGVVAFLLGEMDLEYNMKEMRRLKPQQKRKQIAKEVVTPSDKARGHQYMLSFLESAGFDVKTEIAESKGKLKNDDDVKDGDEDLMTITQPNFVTSLPQPPFIAAIPSKLPPPPAHAQAMPSLPPPPDMSTALPLSALPPIPQTAAAKWAAKQGLPKLSFTGVRASVQGSGCIGAAPAEEPGVSEGEKPPMLGDIPAIHIPDGATPSASPRTDSDLDDDTFDRTDTPPETPAEGPLTVATPPILQPPMDSDTLKIPRLFFKGVQGSGPEAGAIGIPFAEESNVAEEVKPAMLGDIPTVNNVFNGATPIGSQRTDTAHSSRRGQLNNGFQTPGSEIMERVGPVKGFPMRATHSPPPLNIKDGLQRPQSQRTPHIREDIPMFGGHDGELPKRTHARSSRRRKSHGASPTSPLPKSLTRSESLEGLSDTPHTSTLSAGGSYCEEGPSVAFNVFYFQQRSMRNLYFDDEVHLLMLTLLFALLLTPKRHLLDQRYCDRNAVLNHKEDIPDILAHHLNHQMNTGLLKDLPRALDYLGLEGFRFLKLLCPVMNKKWSYEKAETIASGAFGTVVEISSGFANPKSTARKILRKYGDYGQSLFVDAFNEVSCMETGRFANNVCEIFDFGVDETCYWIIMRYYPTTLRKYREKLLPKGEPVTEEKVTELLGYFGQVVNAVQTLHKYGLYHYDLKCDNIMLDTTQKFNGARDDLAIGAGDNTEINLFGGLHYAALGDFGESRLLEDMSDEWDRRNRGTECIKAPEMLVVDIQKPEIDSFDRRKNVGTNQGADVWSLGCLFFECLTGEYLFRQDFPAFYCNLTKGETFEQLLGSDNTDMIMGMTSEQSSDSRRNGNSDKGECPIWRPSLLAFMRFLLNRNQQRRPDVSLVVTHFIQLYNEVKEKIEMSSYHRENRWTWKMSSKSFVVTPRDAVALTREGRRRDHLQHASPQQSSQDTLGSRAGGVVVPQIKDTNCQKISPKGESRFTQIFKDLYLVEIAVSDSGEAAYLAQECEWTAALDFRCVASVPPESVLPLKRAEIYRVPWKGERNADVLAEHFPVIFDFLRSCCTRGATLLIDGSESPASDGSVAMGLVVALVAEHLKIIYFQAMTALESQMVVTAVRTDIAAAIDAWVNERRNKWVEERKSLRVSCLCGCVEWSFRRSSIDSGSEPDIIYVERCDCDKSVVARCPNNRDCAATASDFEKESGVAEENVHWLWAQNYSKDVMSLNVSQGARFNSEFKDYFLNEDGDVSERFRCRSCRTMTHVVTGTSIAVVCLCEMYRCRAAQVEVRESDFEKSLYEKLRFRWRSLTSFLVPRKQAWLPQKNQREEKAKTMK
eukprot:GEMP01000250.1.p1 GENE.GEMP01000250.1~~GEMP01000250.1.p1  ORF type:complete len:2496 (+),score=449.20 GEMP01000250.1:95-7582(+)